MTIYNLIYISKSTVRMDEADLLQLLEISRDWNERHGITGMLVYSTSKSARSGRFMQVIEGRVETIQTLFDKIKTDKRHHQVTLLNEGFIDHRSFKGWAMGFHLTTLEKEIPGFITPEEILAINQHKANYNIALNFLKSFYSM